MLAIWNIHESYKNTGIIPTTLPKNKLLHRYFSKILPRFSDHLNKVVFFFKKKKEAQQLPTGYAKVALHHKTMILKRKKLKNSQCTLLPFIIIAMYLDYHVHFNIFKCIYKSWWNYNVIHNFCVVKKRYKLSLF